MVTPPNTVAALVETEALLMRSEQLVEARYMVQAAGEVEGQSPMQVPAHNMPVELVEQLIYSLVVAAVLAD